MEPITVFVDGRNVQRSQWPNVSDDELVDRVCAWAADEAVHAVIVFDGRAPDAEETEHCVVVGTGREIADDWIAREAKRLADDGRPYRLITSDRELRNRAGRAAEAVTGGGSFLKNLP